MNGVDLAILALTALSALAGLWRGLVREVLGIGAWVAAVLLAIRFLPELTALGLHLTANPTLAASLGGAGGFVVALAVFSLVTRLLARAVSASPLGGIDRLLGFAFGLARAAVGVVLCYMLASLAAPLAVWPDVVQSAQSLPYIYRGARLADAWMPNAFRVHLEVPPSMTASSPAPQPDAPKL